VVPQARVERIAEGIAEQIDRFEDIPDIRALTSRLVGAID